jgi:hypothetical protein
MIFADITLQTRTKNALRVDELSPDPAAQVNKQAENHPSAEYLKVILADIGTSGLRTAVDQARAGVADLMANAKLKHGEDRVLALQELLPRFEAGAQSACKDAGYTFSALRSLSAEQPNRRDTLQTTSAPVQPTVPENATKTVVPNSSPALTVTTKPTLESTAQEKASREQEANRQREQAGTARKKEAEFTDAAKKRARAMVRAASPQERTSITNAVAKTLFDAESARYGEVRVIPQSLACVEVNAKNRFGGYTGFQSVVAKYIKGQWYSIQSLRDLPISCLEIIAELHSKDNED